MTNSPLKIGIILNFSENINVTALKYLILYQNVIQESIEFQILPNPQDSTLLDKLKTNAELNREDIEEEIKNYEESYLEWLNKRALEYGLRSENHDCVVVVSMAKFSDNYYLSWGKEWAIIALGHWERVMAPPSVFESILTLLLQVTIDVACGEDWPRRHHSTKGCTFDFTASLSDARYKALTGYICSTCEKTIVESCSERFFNDVKKLHTKDWLGTPDSPSVASLTVKKLGYDLFYTKGVKPSFSERIRQTLEEELVKNILKIMGTIIVAVILVWLGLKST